MTGFVSDEQRRAVMAKLKGKLVMGPPSPRDGKDYRVSYVVPTDQGVFVSESKGKVYGFAKKHGLDPSTIMILRQRRHRKEAKRHGE